MKTRGALTIPVQGVEALMGHGESRREVHPATDDLDVACRLARGGPGQRGVELTERGDFRREPAPAAQGGGQGVIVPGGEVIVDPIWIRLERPLDHVALVVEDEDDRLQAIAP